MTMPGVPELRRIVSAVERLRGETVREATVRSDLRHLRLEFASGLILIVAVERDEAGRPRFELDVVTAPPEAVSKPQIEVRFE